MSANNTIHFSAEEVDAAITELDPEVVAEHDLHALREAVNRTLDPDWSERHFDASKICVMAAAKFCIAINTLNLNIERKSQAYDVLFVSTVLGFQESSVERMQEYLDDAHSDGLWVDIKDYYQYFTLQCVLIGLKTQAGIFDLDKELAAINEMKTLLLQKFMKIEAAQLFLDVARGGQQHRLPETALDIFFDISDKIFISAGIFSAAARFNQLPMEYIHRVTPADTSSLIHRRKRPNAA